MYNRYWIYPKTRCKPPRKTGWSVVFASMDCRFPSCRINPKVECIMHRVVVTTNGLIGEVFEPPHLSLENYETTIWNEVADKLLTAWQCTFASGDTESLVTSCDCIGWDDVSQPHLQSSHFIPTSTIHLFLEFVWLKRDVTESSSKRGLYLCKMFCNTLSIFKLVPYIKKIHWG